MRLAFGVGYRGCAYRGWQSQPGVPTVQDAVERALSQFGNVALHAVCAGRTDAGVHGLNQVIHVDGVPEREAFSWLRGTNRYLPRDIALLWCRPVGDDFHARNCARGRRYRYLVLQSTVRPALESGMVGWSFRPLDAAAMTAAAGLLIGQHDFSAFRAAGCQSPSPVKTLHSLQISRRGAYWRFDFDGNAFLHHMVRNLMGALLRVGNGAEQPGWVGDVLASRDRAQAAPTFAADGLYFVGPYYDARHDIPAEAATVDWLP